MNRKQIEELLSSFAGKTIDLCYEIVDALEGESFEKQVKLIGYFCESYGYMRSDKTKKIAPHISEDKLESLKELYGKLVNELLETTLKKAYETSADEDSFYQSLWGNIAKSGTFNGIDEKSFALYYMVIDRKIPYFLLKKGMKMDAEVFEDYIEKNIDIVKKLRFILFNSFSQKTEEASIIFDEIMGLESYEEQVVVFTSVLETLRQEQKKLYEVIRGILEEASE